MNERFSCGRPDGLLCGHDSCGACCGRSCGMGPALSPEEIGCLELFAATPFLPVVQGEAGGDVSVPVPGLAGDPSALLGLERRGLVRIDPEIPLGNFDYSGYGNGSHGSAALTARGQEALDALEFGGRGC